MAKRDNTIDFVRHPGGGVVLIMRGTTEIGRVMFACTSRKADKSAWAVVSVGNATERIDVTVMKTKISVDRTKRKAKHGKA